MSAPLDPGDVVRLRDLVRERVGLSFPQSRLPDVEWAVRKTLAETGLPDAAALYRLLTQGARHQEPLEVLVSALNVSETHFHRDRNQIRALAERILPEIILRRRSQRRLRLWSAACSTGEEAYTLAILVCQQLEAGVLRRPDRVPAMSFLDLVGYTHLTEQQGDTTAAALVETRGHAGQPVLA